MPVTATVLVDDGPLSGARVQMFVPILVEKRLRETCRALQALPGRRRP